MRQIFITQNNSGDNISVYIKDSAVVITLEREDLSKLNVIEYANNPGIYILIGDENRRYVGQTAGQTIFQRLNQHTQNREKDWFTKVIFFGRTDGHLTKTQTDFLEGKIIGKFAKSGKFNLQNRTSGNTGWFDDLSKFQANNLWNEVSEILENFAKINLFGDRLSRKNSSKHLENSIKNELKPDVEKHNNNSINYSVPESKIFSAKDKYMDAKLKYIGKKFVLLSGSKITPFIRVSDKNSENYKYMERKRAQYIDKTSNFIVLEDIKFRSPSGAANFVYGASANGKTFWKDENGENLAEFIKEEK